MDNKLEQKVNYILETIKNSTKLSKTEGFGVCKEYLIDHYCEPVIIKVNEDFKKEWYSKEERNLKKQYSETCLALETIYIANIYQGRWNQERTEDTIFAQSLGQLLRQDDTIENIVDYPIDWMVVNL